MMPRHPHGLYPKGAGEPLLPVPVATALRWSDIPAVAKAARGLGVRPERAPPPNCRNRRDKTGTWGVLGMVA